MSATIKPLCQSLNFWLLLMASSFIFGMAVFCVWLRWPIDSTADVITALASTFFMSTIFGALFGSFFSSKHDHWIYTTNHWMMEGLLFEFIRKTAPRCVGFKNGKPYALSLVHEFRFDSLGAFTSPVAGIIPDRAALRGICEKIREEIDSAEKDTRQALRRLDFILLACGLADSIDEAAQVSIEEAHKIRLEYTRFLEHGQPLLFSKNEAARSTQLPAGDKDLKKQAETLGMEFIDLSVFTPDEALIQEIPSQSVYWYRVFPVSIDGETLVVATADPENVRTCDDLEQLLGRPVKTVVADPELVKALSEKYYVASDTHIEAILPSKEKDSDVD